MSSIEIYKCLNGCTFAKLSDDPTICKCAAEVMGKRPKSSDRERALDAKLSEQSFESSIAAVALQRVNERIGYQGAR